MRIQVISDVHAEFHDDHGRRFAAALKPDGADVLVVAGDLSQNRYLEEALRALCSRYRHVVYTPGNHEYYMSSRPDVQNNLHRLVGAIPNLHVLDDGTAVVEGLRFVGSTLWFEDTPRSAAYRQNLNDFDLIRDFSSWVFVVNRRAREFLRRTVRNGDVVVTHHVPVASGVHSRWRAHPMNDFYVCDMAETVWVNRPGLWIYGHTHESHDFVLERTRFVSNPFGYFGREENPEFDFGLAVDL